MSNSMMFYLKDYIAENDFVNGLPDIVSDRIESFDYLLDHPELDKQNDERFYFTRTVCDKGDFNIILIIIWKVDDVYTPLITDIARKMSVYYKTIVLYDTIVDSVNDKLLGYIADSNKLCSVELYEDEESDTYIIDGTTTEIIK